MGGLGADALARQETGPKGRFALPVGVRLGCGRAGQKERGFRRCESGQVQILHGLQAKWGGRTRERECWVDVGSLCGDGELRNWLSFREAIGL